jgi:hypothetical protein
LLAMINKHVEGITKQPILLNGICIVYSFLVCISFS